MSLDTAIANFRRKQEALFRDECSIMRASEEEAEFDASTGDYELPAPTLIYEGPCQARPAGGLVGTDVVAGERELRLKDLILKLPVNTPVLENDVVEITGSEYDADLITRTFRITDVLRDGRQIARVCVMEETA